MTTATWRKENWRCRTCGKTGTVMMRADDTVARELQRITQAHKIRSRKQRDHCPNPDLIRTR